MEPATNKFKKRPRVEQILPSQCLSCDSPSGYQRTQATSRVPLKGEAFDINYECMECPVCHHRILSTEQLETRISLTVAAYQRAHLLMTASEVLNRRKAIGFDTQQEFADAASPSVSIATLKRLEAGRHIQDAATDFVIRKQLESLEEKHRQHVIFEMLENRGSAQVNYSTRTPSVASGAWLQNFAALPLAACISIIITTSSIPKFPSTTNVEESSPC